MMLHDYIDEATFSLTHTSVRGFCFVPRHPIVVQDRMAIEYRDKMPFSIQNETIDLYKCRSGERSVGPYVFFD
jgi:hypothetical protein